MYSKIQYISQGNTSAEQLDNIRQALDAGCSWIQLRFKNASQQNFMKLAEQVKTYCKQHQAVFIVNDHVSIAEKVDADGVHLGLQDTAVSQARQILGEDKIIGGTANTLSDVLQRVQEGCNYIGLGPFRFTSTKEKLSPVLGLTGYETILSTLKKEEVKIPVYAIGGIVQNDISDLIACGIYGIAVSGLITHSTDKKNLVKHLKFSLYAPIEYSQHEI
jgi:thiamine-phosphate pyrophosphorylase